ncbi:CYFA0S15e01618g1_1 [Cyberlindnera fabianii]|uniref:CYFA0S15e01618g1_1 n=1 Tax=Cyberlindnera fabianii TaxID=36022 RepID=A0A061B9Y6_CYBFA|nr:CYFA0S15e01618g1_1 [Cyberlindnera fabianii]
MPDSLTDSAISDNVKRSNTEPEPLHNLNRAVSVASAATEPNMTQIDHEPIRRRVTYHRAKTLPTLSRTKREYKIPDAVLQKKPTLKQEASVFYSMIHYIDELKDQLVDKSMERADKFYEWFFSLSLVKAFTDKYHKWEKIFIIGEILQIIRLFLNTRSVIFLPFFPAGIVCYKRGMDYEAVVFLFLALMYFAKVLSNCTEIAAEHYGPVIGALLNATFGNLVELIISGTTVSKDDATLTITNLIGSVVSNNLFVCGSCYFFGGLEGIQVHQKKPLVSHLVFFLSITLLLALMSVMHDIDSAKMTDKFKMDTSQAGASLIFLNYLVYLVMNTNEEFKALRVKKAKAQADLENNMNISDSDSDSDDSDEEGNSEKSSSADNEEELPSKAVCFGALGLSIAGLGPCANFFVESLKELTDDADISKVFIGLIILPLAGSLPEHMSSIISAKKGNMDLALNLAIGSSNQVLGFVLPIIQFISSMYPSTRFSLYIVDEIASYLYVTGFITVLILANGALYGVNVYHGVLSLSTFAIIIYLTFANDSV